MCKLDKRLLYSYADGSIEPLEEIIVAEHLKYCKKCEEELLEIQQFDKELEELDFDDIEIPLRLGKLTELILDNCIESLGRVNIQDEYSNYKESLSLIKNTLKEGYKLRYSNPYNKMMKKGITASGNFVKKETEKYFRNKFKKTKFSKSLLCKILRAV